MSERSAELRTVRERPRAVATAVVRQVRDDVPFMAGSIAYQAFASLVPIFVLRFLLVTVVGDPQQAHHGPLVAPHHPSSTGV
jgi:uncharacterized BrkB/YihY/UPF0761 family membrane protein